MDTETEANINALRSILALQDGFEPSDQCDDPKSCIVQGVCRKAAAIFQELRYRVEKQADSLADTISLNPSCGSRQYEEVMKTAGQIYPDVS